MNTTLSLPSKSDEKILQVTSTVALSTSVCNNYSRASLLGTPGLGVAAAHKTGTAGAQHSIDEGKGGTRVTNGGGGGGSFYRTHKPSGICTRRKR